MGGRNSVAMQDDLELRGMSLNNGIAHASPSFSHRFLGGPPLAVLVRLAFVSLVVGALLVWFRVEPLDVYHAIIRLAGRIWAMGFDALGELGRYVLSGAVIVVPIGLVTRLLTIRGTR